MEGQGGSAKVYVLNDGTEASSGNSEQEREQERVDDLAEGDSGADARPIFLLEKVSRVWGLGLIGTLLNVIFVLVVSSFELTDWGHDGESKGAALPKPSKVAWIIVYVFLLPLVLSLRTTFSCVTHDPLPLPGREYLSWKYAKVCFFTMFFTTMFAGMISYALPVYLGATPEL